MRTIALAFWGVLICGALAALLTTPARAGEWREGDEIHVGQACRLLQPVLDMGAAFAADDIAEARTIEIAAAVSGVCGVIDSPAILAARVGGPYCNGGRCLEGWRAILRDGTAVFGLMGADKGPHDPEQAA